MIGIWEKWKKNLINWLLYNKCLPLQFPLRFDTFPVCSNIFLFKNEKLRFMTWKISHKFFWKLLCSELKKSIVTLSVDFVYLGAIVEQQQKTTSEIYFLELQHTYKYAYLHARALVRFLGVNFDSVCGLIAIDRNNRRTISNKTKKQIISKTLRFAKSICKFN